MDHRIKELEDIALTFARDVLLGSIIATPSQVQVMSKVLDKVIANVAPRSEPNRELIDPQKMTRHELDSIVRKLSKTGITSLSRRSETINFSEQNQGEDLPTWPKSDRNGGIISKPRKRKRGGHTAAPPPVPAARVSGTKHFPSISQTFLSPPSELSVPPITSDLE